MATILKASLICAAIALALPAAASAAPEIHTVAGASPAALEATVNAFKAGAASEINWDGVPATATSPNRLPGGFFAQRGASFDTPGTGTEVADGAPWGGGFQRYSGDKLFAPVGSNYANVRFNVPGSSRQAYTSAFGVVLSDVDTTNGAGITFLDARGATILEVAVPPGPNGLSFVGVRFRDGERVAEVQIRAGSSPIAPGVVDSPQTDLAAIDDVLFSPPQADLAPPPEVQFLPSDVAGGLEGPSAAPRQRASLLPLAKSVRRNRTLKVIIGSSVDAEGELRLGKSSKTLTLEAGATPFAFKVPANAKKGKQRLVLTVGAIKKSVTVKVL
jgi:hypothetical protein